MENFPKVSDAKCRARYKPCLAPSVAPDSDTWENEVSRWGLEVSLSEVLALWRSKGSPVVRLDPGVAVTDLEKWLAPAAGPPPLPEAVERVLQQLRSRS